MGIFSDIKAVGAVQKIAAGGKAKLSISQITNLLINLPDAQKNLSESDFSEVYSLYQELRKCNTKMDMDKQEYYNTVISIIKRFDAIAPYEKYSGGNETEFSFMMDEIRNTEEPKKPENTAFDSDVRDLLNQDDIQSQVDICEEEYKKAMKLLDNPTKKNVHKAYDIMGNLAARFDYVPAIMWMGDFQESALKNLQQAAFWFKKAADLGDGDGARCYADMLMTGRGVDKDMNLAMSYYADAADKGIPEAAFVLGEFFRNAGDSQNALKAYKQAYDGGFAPAKTRIDQMKNGK